MLRIEDIDSPRVKVGAAQQAIDDLHWLGLDWDDGPDVGGPHAPYVQTQRRELYAAALEELRKAERVYPCTCTRSDVADATSAPHAGQESPRYPGTCAGRTSADAAALDRPYVWRFRASNERRVLNDRFVGRIECTAADELGDFVVAKGDGTPAYQLAVVVDDHAMGVSEVVRGDDLIPSAFRQLELYAFFGWPPPIMSHVPLVVGPDGRRLAKRHGDTRLATFRDVGCTAEQMVGFLAWSCRLRPTNSPIAAKELIHDFDFSVVPREQFIVTDDIQRLLLK